MNKLDWGFSASAAVPKHDIPTWPTDTTIRSVALVGDSITGAGVSQITATAYVINGSIATLTTGTSSYKQHTPISITNATPAGANIATRVLSQPDSTHITAAIPLTDSSAQPLTAAAGIRVSHATSTPGNFWGYAAMRTAALPPLLAIDGIGGSTIEDMIARFDGVAQYKPSHIHFMGGTNNIYGDYTAEQIAALSKQYCEVCRAKGIQVLCASIPPRGMLAPTDAGYAAKLESQRRSQEANALIKAYADATPGVTYVDYWPALCDSTSPEKFGRAEYYMDNLHPNAAGYNVMGKTLAALLDAQAVGIPSGPNRMPNAGFISVDAVPVANGGLINNAKAGGRPTSYYPSRSTGATLTGTITVANGVMTLDVSGAAPADSVTVGVTITDCKDIILTEDTDLYMDFKVKGTRPVSVKLAHGLAIDSVSAPTAPVTWTGIIYPSETYMCIPARGYRLKAGEKVSVPSVTWYFQCPDGEAVIDVTEPRLWLAPAHGS